MASPSAYQFDVYISHSPEEREWVDAWLLPRLEEAGLRVYVDYRDSLAGAPRANNIERAMKGSRRTVAVVTPAWVASEWNLFEDALVRSLDPAALRRRLIPIKLKACGLPESLAALEGLDLTAERRWEQGIRRLRRDLEDVVPVAVPWRQDPAEPLWTRWRRWLRRYRREVRRGVVLSLAGWLLLSLTLQLPPFGPSLGWHRLSPQLLHAYRLWRVGEVLLVATDTSFPGCSSTEETGLWRSTDRGATWQKIPMPSLVFDKPDGECDVAAIDGLAYALDEPRRIYATTFDVGLLHSDDAGVTWEQIGGTGLPTALASAAVNPTDPSQLIVTAADRGIFRTLDGGVTWHRLDGQSYCGSPERGSDLPTDFDAGALLYTGTTIYLGSWRDYPNLPQREDGLYASEDGGDCWRRIDDAQGRYNYKALANLPQLPLDLLVLVRDGRAAEGEPTHRLWWVRRNEGRYLSLWETTYVLDDLLITQGQSIWWYVASDLGTVAGGLLDGTKSSNLPRITHCVGCLSDLATDFDGTHPLLLASERVYRLAKVPWYRRLWP